MRTLPRIVLPIDLGRSLDSSPEKGNEFNGGRAGVRGIRITEIPDGKGLFSSLLTNAQRNQVVKPIVLSSPSDVHFLKSIVRPLRRIGTSLSGRP